MRHYYKVCRVEDGHYLSAVVDTDFRLEYKINEKTTPKVGYIFLFNTKERALEWATSQCDNFVILAGEMGFRKTQYHIMSNPNWRVANMIDFWNGEHNNSGVWPVDGTVFTDYFIPREIVNERK